MEDVEAPDEAAGEDPAGSGAKELRKDNKIIVAVEDYPPRRRRMTLIISDGGCEERML